MINTQLQAFLSDWDRLWSTLPAGAGPVQRRAHFEQVAAAMRQPAPAGVNDEEVQIEVPGAGRSVRVQLLRSAAAGTARPALIYMHGGAWMQGSPQTHFDITAGIAAATGHVVISVDYALMPEHPFPAAVHDCRAVVEWVFDHASGLKLNREAIAIGGDSAGGNLAAAQTLIFRDSGRRLNAQLLIYPAVDFSLDRSSHQENAEGPIITVASMPFVNAMYCQNPDDLRNPLAAPLLAASHARLPPAFIAVAEHDPLRDEGLAYAQALQAAGVRVELDRGPGLIHGYLRAMAYCTDARTAFERMCRWLIDTNGS